MQIWALYVGGSSLLGLSELLVAKKVEDKIKNQKIGQKGSRVSSLEPEFRILGRFLDQFLVHILDVLLPFC